MAILQIGEEVDRRTAEFHGLAAWQCHGDAQRRIHKKLAAWRIRHQSLLMRMQREWTKSTEGLDRSDSDDCTLPNPRAMAGLAWPGTNPLLLATRMRDANTQQIIRDALRRCNGIAIFYHGLKGFVGTRDNLEVIDELIQAENRHASLLCRYLEQVQACRERHFKPVPLPSEYCAEDCRPQYSFQ